MKLITSNIEKKTTILLLILFFSNIFFTSCSRRDPRRKDIANVHWDRRYTLHSLNSDKPILPNENGEYSFWTATNENPTPKQFELKKGVSSPPVYKFITYDECVQFCNSIRKSKGINLIGEKSSSINSKKELVYTSILNTSSKEWQSEFNQIMAQSNEIELATKRIELHNNTKMPLYDKMCIKCNGYECKKNSIEQYNSFKERDIFNITDKFVIKKLIKAIDLIDRKKDVDFSVSYGVKDKDAGLANVYLKINGIWKCFQINGNEQKTQLFSLFLKKNILPLSEASKLDALKLLTGLDDKYFSYVSQNIDDERDVKDFKDKHTSIENSKYTFIGSFNSDMTKKWGILLDEDKDTLFVGKWENDFPSLENGKTFIYKYSEQKVFLEKNGMIFRYNTKNASVYVGQAGYSGFGTQIYSISGGYYVGNYLDGYLHGYGSYFYSNGYYEGQWVNNNRTGEGKYFFNNGEVWSGEWNNGKFTGMGKKTFKNGQVEEGLYENDKLSKSLAQIESERKFEIERIEREKIEEQNRIEQEQDSKEQEKKISEKELALLLSKIKWNPVSKKTDKCQWCSRTIQCDPLSKEVIEWQKEIWINTGMVIFFVKLNKMAKKKNPYIIDIPMYECDDFCSEKCGYEYRRVH